MAVVYSQNGVIVKPTGFDVIGGKKYKTVQMPDGKIWLAENLDFKFCNIGGSGTPSTANAWYYNNDESTYGWNGYKCGLLYNWYAVKLLNDNRSELCPGWHVPSNNEWESLISSIGNDSGHKLKSLDNSVTQGFPSNWNGINSYLFSVLPCGRYDNGFKFFNERGNFWTSTQYSSTESYGVFFTSDVLNNDFNPKEQAYQIRLVRDAT